MTKVYSTAEEAVAIRTAFALVHAHLGDTAGNLVFDKAAMKFNPLAAMAGKVTAPRVETLVERGEIEIGAGTIHLPGVLVQRAVHIGLQEERIEKRTVRRTGEAERRTSAGPASIGLEAELEVFDGDQRKSAHFVLRSLPVTQPYSVTRFFTHATWIRLGW